MHFEIPQTVNLIQQLSVVDSKFIVDIYDIQVLKHQQIIEELMEENKKLRQILVEDLKVPSSKLEISSSSRIKPACSDCFECRRKQRKKWR